MTNLIYILISIIGLLTIYKISFDNINKTNTTYALSFCTTIVVFYITIIFSSLLHLTINPIYICILIGIIFLIVSTIYSKKINIYNFKHLLFPIVVGTLAMLYAGKYVHYVSLTGDLDTISFLSSFTNNQTPFYQFFYSLFNIFDLNHTINTIPLFNSILVFLYFFFLADSIYIYSHNNTIKIVSFLSYFVFFISFACFKFPYIIYLWIVFPINIIFNYIDYKKISLPDSFIIAIAYLTIFVIINNSIISTIIICLTLIINELSGYRNDVRYKLIMIVGLSTFIFTNLKVNIYTIAVIVLLLLLILVKILKIKNIIYLLALITLTVLIIIKPNFDIFNLYTLDSSKILIDFLNFESNKKFLIYTYIILLSISIISFKKFKRFNRQIILTLLIVFNPLILKILSTRLSYSFILLFLLFNPKTIELLFTNAYSVMIKYNLSNNFIIASAILVAFCSSSVLYPNIYDIYIYDDNPIHRMSEDELGVYTYIYDNNIDISGNVVSQAPNTAAYLPNITLLNDYYYYTQLPNNDISDAPNNLTNVFALRQYHDTKYFNQERNFEEAIEQLSYNNYTYMILRKDQTIIYNDNYLPLYLYYTSYYNIIYENDTYILMELI